MQNYILGEGANAVKRGMTHYELKYSEVTAILFIPSTYFTENKPSNSPYGSLNSVMIKSHELEK